MNLKSFPSHFSHSVTHFAFPPFCIPLEIRSLRLATLFLLVVAQSESALRLAQKLNSKKRRIEKI